MTSPFSRYNSFEYQRLDEKLLVWDRRLSNLETSLGLFANPNSKIARLVPGTTNITSTAYVDFSTLSLSYNKLSGTTLLRVGLAGSGYCNTAPCKVTFGVDVDDDLGFPFFTDYDVALFHFDTASARRAWYYERSVPDTAGTTLPAGAYTVQVRVKVSGNTFTCGADDLFNLKLSEVAP